MSEEEEEEQVTFKLGAADASIYLLEMMRECSTYLDRKHGYVLGGSPLIADVIKHHFEADPSRNFAFYGMLLIAATDELRKCILLEKQQLLEAQQTK